MELKKLSEIISEIQPTEVGGALANQRLTYQQDWTIFRLIQLYQSNKNFVILCEYYDDYVELDDPEEPKKISFFQIKSSKSARPWKLTELTSKTGKDRNKPSILAKLMHHHNHFSDWIDKTALVSNKAFSFKLESNEDSTAKEEIFCGSLEKNELQKLKRIITEQVGIVESSLESLVFMISPIPLTNPSPFIKGQLTEFFEESFPNKTFKVSPLYNTLIAEIERRSNNTNKFDTITELAKEKGITRANFRSMIMAGLEPDKSKQETLDGIIRQLQAEEIGWEEIKRIKNCWNIYTIQSMDHSNILIKTLRQKITSELKTLTLNGSFNERCVSCIKHLRKERNYNLNIELINAIVYEWNYNE